GAGTIVEIGERITDFKVGDRVAISWIPMCGTCRFCLMGRPALCDRPGKHGPKMPDGTSRLRDKSGKELNHFMSTAVMAEFATLHRLSLIKIDDTIPLECAALVGCAVTTGVGAVFNTAKVSPGSSVAVFGCGGVGLSAIQGARIAGAGRIIAVDTLEPKLAMAKRFGATDVILARKDDDLVKPLKKLTGGGPDYAFECVGSGELAGVAYRAIRRGGKAVVVGVARASESTSVRSMTLVFEEKTLTGSYFG